VEADDPLEVFPKVWMVQFPAGSNAPSNTPIGGDGFQATFGLTSKRSLGLDYYAYFPEGFQFVKGGKLPGLYGGDTDGASGCDPQSDDAFSARLMWRTGGQAELYLYTPQRDYVASPGSCGESIGRGSYTFPTGEWVHIRQLIELTDGADRIRLWFGDMNTHPAIDVSGYDFETPGHPLTIDGLWLQSFYGGSDATWAPTTDQTIYFGGFTIWEP
jgi:hypothetical protein